MRLILMLVLASAVSFQPTDGSKLATKRYPILWPTEEESSATKWPKTATGKYPKTADVALLSGPAESINGTKTQPQHPLVG